MQDHQEESQGCQVELGKSGVCNPLPLIWVDFLHGIVPFWVVHHLPNVTNRETMNEGQARQSKGEVRSEATLLDVSEDPPPVVTIEISAAQQENASTEGMQILREVS